MVSWIRLAPITAELTIVCLVIFASCFVPSRLSRERFADRQRECGAIQTQRLVESWDGVGRTSDLELYGPLDLWEGPQWKTQSWRIPLTAIHHDDLLHLLICLGAAWYLGSRLEQHWGSFTMCLFLLPAICLPVLAELAAGQAMMGFSGVVCAMLGALVILREYDNNVAARFSLEAAQVGMSMIAVGWLASVAGDLAFPTLGHLAGFAYGSLVGILDVYGRRQSRPYIFRWVMLILSVFCFTPGTFLVCHPTWLARYHWYQAISSKSPAETKRHLQEALHLDPALAPVWLRWSRLAESEGNLAEAWEHLMRGLAFNPSSSPLIEATQRLWRHLDSGQRHEAETIIRNVFGHRANLWLDQIRAGSSVANPENNENASNDSEKVDLRQFSLDQKVELHSTPAIPAEGRFPAPISPLRENDAMEGKSL
jgi:membrane associated rhomboid family serine protease